MISRLRRSDRDSHKLSWILTLLACYFHSELFGFFSDLFRFKFGSLGVNSIIDTMSLKKSNNGSSSDADVDVLWNSSPQCFGSTKRT
jgi:hypothetical protein